MRRMARLSAGLAFGLFLDDGLGRPKWIGGRGQRGVGTIGTQPGFEFGNAAFQLGDASVPFAASRASRGVHAAMLVKAASLSCAILRDLGERLLHFFPGV